VTLNNSLLHTTGRLEYKVVGVGEPVLFIHGAYFEDVLIPVINEPALSGYQRIHYHRRGYGDSIAHDGCFSMTQEAADAFDLLRHLNLEEAHVVGYSSGGVIAVELARSEPAAVQSLILIEPALQLPEGIRRGIPPNLAQAFECYGAGDTEGAVNAFWQMLSGHDWRTVVTTALPNGIDQALRNARLFFELEAKAVLAYPFDAAAAATISQPILYLISSATAPHRAEMRKLFLSWLPQTSELLVRDADHALPLQQPHVIAAGINEFLAQQR
jgi:pimeloyl-ACP methyl ester carboxylesterase